MNSLIIDIAKWHKETFPHANEFGSLCKIEEEFYEVQTAENYDDMVEEIADLIITAIGLSVVINKDINHALLRKHEINKSREWKKSENGSYKHVKEESAL